MKIGNNISRENIIMSTLPEMFNRSTYKYANCRCQWYQPDPQQPTKTASLTYGQVRLIVQDLTCGLQSLGLNPQDRVAIMSKNCPEWLWADFSILCNGAITVPIYPTFRVPDIAYIVNDSSIRFIYVKDAEGLQKIAQGLKDMPSLEKVIVFDHNVELPNDRFIHLRTLIDRGKKYAAQNRNAYLERSEAVNLKDVCTIVYTSGTTGNPKGAVHTHFSLMSSLIGDLINCVRSGYIYDENDISLCFLPLSHTYERECGQMTTICTGGTIAYAESPSTVMRDLKIYNPNWFCGVPRIFERIFMSLRDAASATPESKAEFERAIEIGEKVIACHTDEKGFIDLSLNKDFREGLSDELLKEYEWAEATVFSRVRALLGKNFIFAHSGSASLPPGLFRLFSAMGIRIKEGYGLTETMNAVCSNSMKAVLPGGVGNVKVCSEVKLGEDGELLVRGDNIFIGYWNNPEATVEAFDEEGFFHTGDIAVREHNSTFDQYWYKIVDRKKSIMVLDTGKNIPRAKVENPFVVSHFVEHICAVADNRKFVSAIIVPKFDVIINLLAKKGIKFDESQMEKLEGVTVKVGGDFTSHPEVRALIDTDVAVVNKELAEYEQIKKYHISNRIFSTALDEITPTLKIKYRNIINHFSDAIDELYKK